MRVASSDMDIKISNEPFAFFSIQCCSQSELTIQSRHSEKIDKTLKEESSRRVIKLLILGPGESGKSTFVKQMQIIHLNGFSKEMIEGRKYFAYSNIKRGMLELIESMEQLGIIIKEDLFLKDMSTIEQSVIKEKEYEALSPEIVLAIKRLWRHPKIQDCYSRRSEYHLLDSAKYLFEHIDRISQSDYIPTNQDILQIRVPTTGVVGINFKTSGIDFLVFDAGGQKAQRRKWIHYFDNIDALIFVIAISEFNQLMREDKTNRLLDAMKLFREVTNMKCFIEAGIILFMNKTDLFAEKIRKFPLIDLFPHYMGGLDYANGISFLREQFIRLYKNKSPLYIYETCATDTNQIQQISDSVFNSILTKNLHNRGLT